MMSDKKEHDAALAKFRESYVELFGSWPALPAGRFAFSGEVNPDFLRTAEELRAQAFYNKSFDVKTTQLILFGMLLVEHNQIAAQAHASAARRAGASWEELHTVVELATTTGALAPFNQGSALLNGLREKEEGGKP
jgi:alkylhydroperoxidase/carboxymuconolactone decarboxylase family protein YurZ